MQHPQATAPKSKGQRWARQSGAMAMAHDRWACAPRSVSTRTTVGGRAHHGRWQCASRPMAVGSMVQGSHEGRENGKARPCSGQRMPFQRLQDHTAAAIATKHYVQTCYAENTDDQHTETARRNGNGCTCPKERQRLQKNMHTYKEKKKVKTSRCFLTYYLYILLKYSTFA